MGFWGFGVLGFLVTFCIASNSSVLFGLANLRVLVAFVDFGRVRGQF